jgi:hypothetical protein
MLLKSNHIFCLREKFILETKPTTRKMAKNAPKPQTYTVSFRVDAYHLSRLEKGAAAYKISIHEYARQRLIELLDHQEEARLIEDLGEVKGDVSLLREDLARTLEIVLANTTKVDSTAIRSWVDTNLRRK